MDVLIKELLLRKQRLEKAIKTAEEFLKTAPDGRLRINNRKNFASYFRIMEKGDTIGIYIPSKNSDLVKGLAQKEFSYRFLINAHKELSTINNCIRSLESHNSDNVFSSLSQQRQRLVTPYMADNETCVKKWSSLPFPVNMYEPQEKIFRTKNGEMVRSKSELLLADMYFELGIPYRYECELTLRNGKTRYPDFTLFHAPRRMVIYHEHLGLLDEEDYLTKNLKKLREYEESGIYVGKNLLLTFESKKCPFDPHSFREQLKEIFWLI